MKVPAALLLLALGACASPPAGTLVVVGGGGTPDAALAAALEAAPGGTVVVVPYASSREDRGQPACEMWIEAGAERALDLEEQPDLGAALAAADLVWMIGGDQNRLMEDLEELELIDDLRSAYARGAVIGGTSAGAAVMGPTMITGDADLERVRAGATETRPGLGLWSSVIVDQHFLARRRNNRLLAAVLDAPQSLGIGIDERTAVVVPPTGPWRVVGERQVMVFDARESTVRARDGEDHRVQDLGLSLLRPGDQYTP